MIFSTSSYFLAKLMFLNIARMSGCPTPAASFATTSSNFFEETTLNRCTLISWTPIWCLPQLPRIPEPVPQHFRTLHHKSVRPRINQEGPHFFSACCRKGAGIDITHTPLQKNAFTFTLLIDAINGDCFVARMQNHARRLAV